MALLGKIVKHSTMIEDTCFLEGDMGSPVMCKCGSCSKVLRLQTMCVDATWKRTSLFLLIYLLLIFAPNVHSQDINQNIRPFPALFNAAQYRMIKTEPSQGTCGIPDRSAYCQSSIFPISIDECFQSYCIQQCPGRTEMPNYLSLLVQTTGFSKCVFLDTINTRPGSSFQSASTSFISSGPTCFVTPSVTPDLSSTTEFSITLWIWQKKYNDG